MFLISLSGFWFPNICDFNGSNCPVSTATSEVERIALVAPTQHMSLWGRHPGPSVSPGLCKGANSRKREREKQAVCRANSAACVFTGHYQVLADLIQMLVVTGDVGS